jgi:2'-5' RNA ligase
LGFPRERRAYHPHLTLARIKAKPPAELQEIAEAHKSTPFGRQTIDRVIWYQSELQSTGPVYTSIATILLGLPRA